MFSAFGNTYGCKSSLDVLKWIDSNFRCPERLHSVIGTDEVLQLLLSLCFYFFNDMILLLTVDAIIPMSWKEPFPSSVAMLWSTLSAMNWVKLLSDGILWICSSTDRLITLACLNRLTSPKETANPNLCNIIEPLWSIKMIQFNCKCKQKWGYLHRRSWFSDNLSNALLL